MAAREVSLLWVRAQKVVTHFQISVLVWPHVSDDCRNTISDHEVGLTLSHDEKLCEKSPWPSTYSANAIIKKLSSTVSRKYLDDLHGGTYYFSSDRTAFMSTISRCVSSIVVVNEQRTRWVKMSSRRFVTWSPIRPVSTLLPLDR